MNLPTGLHLYNPLVYTSCLLAEIYTHLDDFPSVCRKGSGIAFLFDLPHGFFGRSVQFELHDIDVVGCLQQVRYSTSVWNPISLKTMYRMFW